MTSRLGTLPIVACFVVLCGIFGVTVPLARSILEATPAPQEDAPLALPPTIAPSTLEVSFPTDDDALTQWIRGRLEECHTLSERSLREGYDMASLAHMHRLADETLLASRYHMDQFPHSPNRSAVAVLRGRALVLNQQRHLMAYQELWKAEHGAPIESPDLIKERDAYAGLVRDVVSQGLAPLRESLGQLFELEAEALRMSGRFSDAADAFGQALEFDPKHRNSDLIAAFEVDSLWWAERFAEAEQRALEFLRTRPRATHFADVLFVLHKTYRNTGRIEDGIALWKRYGQWLRNGADGLPLSPPEIPEPPSAEAQERYRNFADRKAFYLGFYELARGDKDAAMAHLNAFLDLSDARATGEVAMPETTKVYLNFITIPLMHTMVALIGRPAPPMTLPEEDWVIAPPVDGFAADRVRLVLFCDMMRALDRQKPLIQRLVRMHDELTARGLDTVWICQTLKSQPLQHQRNQSQMGELVNELSIPFPSGLDGEPGNPLHEAHTCPNPGTAILLAVDRNGLVAWRIDDPLERDIGLIRRVVDRLLNEAAGH